MNTICKIKFGLIFLTLFFIGLSGSASATLLHVDATATMADEAPVFGLDFNDYLPIGTVVSAAVTFDVSGSAPGLPAISSASGAFTWNDGSDRIFTLDGNTGLIGIHSSGLAYFNFTGTGPTISGLIPDSFAIAFNLGTNPFSVIDPWADLLLGASIQAFGLGLTGPTGSTITASLIVSDDASGTITRVVPEPTIVVLFGIGLAGLGFARKVQA